ncbi:MAG: Heme/hemopexin-binding protein [Chlamydiae bacterium]|nr:Heme/hemopexin-binding protein [Chlamydiota bacterium]
MRWIWFLLLPIALFGKPKGHKVVAGTATVQESGNIQEIQTSERAIIHWDEFSIGAGETTRFLQPNTNSAVLNRVANGTSTIDGLLQANGRVYLLNPNGVLIGPSGSIQAESFIASTLDFDNEDFFKNRELLFQGDSKARIVNLGKIAAIGGDVFLLAKAVVNEGSLLANEGVVGIAAGEEILLKPSGMQRLFIAPKQEAEKEDGGIENPGLIEAATAELRADGNAFRFAINQTGTIQANGIKKENGRVFLVAEGGTSINSGTISAPGGKVHVLGEQVGLTETAKIDVSSDFGGGEVLIGGDFQGKNPAIPNAKMTGVMKGAEIVANALLEGDGGKIVVWSDGTTAVQGDLFVCGGLEGGDGGFIEVSGVENLHYSGLAFGDAPQGKKGQLLLDPSEITLNQDPTFSVTLNPSTGVYTANNFNGTLSVFDVQTQLNMGSVDITISTASTFTAPGNILMLDPIAWTSSNNLTLLAENNIALREDSGFDATGSGSVTLNAKNDIQIEQTETFETASGLISLEAGNDILLFPDITPVIIKTDTGNLSLKSGRNCTLGLANLSSKEVILETATGIVQADIGGDLSLFGSGTASQVMLIDVGNSGTGISIFNIGGNLIMRGGPQTRSRVQIGHQRTVSSFMNFSVGGNVELTGGSGPDSFAQIGFTSGEVANQSGSGNIVFTEIGGNVQLTAGAGTNAFAQIGHTNGFTAISGYNGSGNVLLNDIRGDVSLQANKSSAIIGLGNPVTGGADTYQGSVLVDAIGIVSLTASDDAPAAIGFSVGGAGTSQAQSSSISVFGEGLNLTAANEQDAYVGFYNSAGTTIDPSDMGTVFVSVRQDINLNGGQTAGPGVSGAAVIGTGGTSSNIFANVRVIADDIFLRCTNDGPALIQTSSSAIRNVEIEAENITAFGTGSTVCAKILATGDILAIADFDIILRNGSSVTSPNGSITLVVDNHDPESPDIGDGRFILDQGAFIDTTGPVRIFTAKRIQNSVGGVINGENFVPGLLFLNSATEQWATYFPDEFGGTPFTFFYKSGLPNVHQNELWRALAEMFQNLRTYDDLLYDCKWFLFGYDDACYDPFFYPKGMVSSFDLFGEETREMLRRKYRNYHTKRDFL